MLEDIVLNPVLILVIFVGLFIWFSRWAIGQREVPGWILGVLIGVFFIILYQSATGTQPDTQAIEESASRESTLSFMQILMPSLFGLLSGLVTLAVIAVVTRTRVRQSATVAIITALLVIVIFLITVLGENTVRMFGIFAMAYGIGILSVLVFAPTGAGGGNGGGGGLNATRERYREQGDVPRADPDRSQDRFDSIRRKYDDRR